ncbi:MAG TPA: sulfotransferase [Actinocatenispora sp.]
MLSIVGAAFGRTGTSSAREALVRLGLGPCHGMRQLFTDDAHAAAWLRAAEGGPVDWRRLLDGYGATVAWPASAFWRELADAYPKAKVLLLVRDPDAWYDSVARTLFRTRPAGATTDHRTPVRDRAIERIVWRGTFGGRFADRAYALGVYAAHRDRVRREVPAERLVEVDVADGWGPLCAALGVGVPDEPFPVANTTEEYLTRARRAGALTD